MATEIRINDCKIAKNINGQPDKQSTTNCYRDNLLILTREAINYIILYKISDTSYLGDRNNIKDGTIYIKNFNNVVDIIKKIKKEERPDFYINNKTLVINSTAKDWKNLSDAITNLTELNILREKQHGDVRIWQFIHKQPLFKLEDDGKPKIRVLTVKKLDEIISILLLFFIFEVEQNNIEPYTFFNTELTKLKQYWGFNTLSNFQLLNNLKQNQFKQNQNCIAIIDYLLNSGEELKLEDEDEPEPSTQFNRGNINLTSGFASFPTASTTEDNELPLELPGQIEEFGPDDGFGNSGTENEGIEEFTKNDGFGPDYEEEAVGGGRKRTRKNKKSRRKRTRKNRRTKTKKIKHKKKRTRRMRR